VKKGINPAINLVGRECVDDLSLMHISTCFTYAGVSQTFGAINRIYTAFEIGLAVQKFVFYILRALEKPLSKYRTFRQHFPSV
jgi:hypothetical protein